MTDQTQLLREALEAFDAFGEADDVPSLLALTQKMEAIRTALAQPAEGGEPLFILHCGQIDSSGEQDEWETEANGQQRVDDFCRLHPGKKIKLYPAPPASQEQAQQPIAQAWANKTGLRQIECPSCGGFAVAYDPQQPKPQPMTDDQIMAIAFSRRFTSGEKYLIELGQEIASARDAMWAERQRAVQAQGDQP